MSPFSGRKRGFLGQRDANRDEKNRMWGSEMRGWRWQSCRVIGEFVTLCKVQPNSAAAAAKSLQSGPTLCNPIDSSPPGSPVPGILQARTLEWVAISFSSAGK